jgi:hypothetical protein
MNDSIRDTAHAARVAHLAAQAAHIRIVARRVARQPAVPPVEATEPLAPWTERGLSRLLVDVIA